MHQKIIPHLWYDKEAREAADFYVSIFPDSKIINTTVLHDTPSGDAEIVSFELFGQPFMAISAGPMFKFNEAVSFMVECETQDEIDSYWEKLSAVPEAEQCGWLKDKFGLSWQIVPAAMGRMMSEGTPEQVARLVKTLLPMKKISLADLEKAYEAE